jgi:hypothetical protein
MSRKNDHLTRLRSSEIRRDRPLDTLSLYSSHSFDLEAFRPERLDTSSPDVSRPKGSDPTVIAPEATLKI